MILRNIFFFSILFRSNLYSNEKHTLKSLDINNMIVFFFQSIQKMFTIEIDPKKTIFFIPTQREKCDTIHILNVYESHAASNFENRTISTLVRTGYLVTM